MVKSGLIQAEEKTVHGFRYYQLTATEAGKKISGGSGIFGSLGKSRWLLGDHLEDVEVTSFSEPTEYHGKKVCTAEFTGKVVLSDWVIPEVFLPDGNREVKGEAAFALYDQGWKLETFRLTHIPNGNELGCDQVYNPQPPDEQEVKTLLQTWLCEHPHQFSMQGISIPVYATQNTKDKKPGNDNWIRFSPLVKDKILSAKVMSRYQHFGWVNYNLFPAPDKAGCYDEDSGRWRISDTFEITSIKNFKTRQDIQGDIQGFGCECQVRFVDIYPWMLQYPDIFDKAQKCSQDGQVQDFQAVLMRKDDGSYAIESMQMGSNPWT